MIFPVYDCQTWTMWANGGGEGGLKLVFYNDIYNYLMFSLSLVNFKVPWIQIRWLPMSLYFYIALESCVI